MPQTYLPQLVGIAVFDAPPIRAAFVDLQPGLLVFYGRNGTGKTRLLQAVAEAVGPQPIKARELIYRWPIEDESSLNEMARDEYGRWHQLPGNPWKFSREPDFSGNEQDFVLSEMGEFLSVLNDTFKIPPSRRRSLARQIAVDGEAWMADDEGLKDIVAACEEIAEFALFALSANDANEWLVTALAAPTESCPVLRAISSRLRQSALDLLDEHGALTDDEHELTSTLGLGFFGTSLESVWRSVNELHPNTFTPTSDYDLTKAPWWYGDRTASLTTRAGPPAVLLVESTEDPTGPTLDFIESALTPEGESPSGLIQASTDGFQLHPDLRRILDELGNRATAVLHLLLENSPQLRCQMRPVPEWHRTSAVSWVATDPSGADVDIDQLSRAQERWARFAIQLALLGERAAELPLVIILDEPESALHRRAERFLARGLASLTEAFEASVLIATHSPAFLDASSSRLVHVQRDAAGLTTLDPMPGELRHRIEDLGLEPTDLLQLCRTIVLVEGQHELVVFNELFGDEFGDAGVEVFSIRGARNLANAADAQLLFNYTNARVVVVVDNEDSQRTTDIWSRACAASDNDDNPLPILFEFTEGKRNAEAIFLREFCQRAITTAHRDRIRFYPLSLPDLPEYLPVRAVAPGVPTGTSWTELRSQHSRSNKGMPFKGWMQREFNADYSDAALRGAAQQLDEIHPDLVGLLEAVTETDGIRSVFGPRDRNRN